MPYLHARPRRPSCYLAHTLHSSLAVDIDALTKPLCLMIIEYNSRCWLFSRMFYPPLKGTKPANGQMCSLPFVLHIILLSYLIFSKDISYRGEEIKQKLWKSKKGDNIKN